MRTTDAWLSLELNFLLARDRRERDREQPVDKPVADGIDELKSPVAVLRIRMSPDLGIGFSSSSALVRNPLG